MAPLPPYSAVPDLLKQPCKPVTSIIVSGHPLPLTEKLGDTPLTNQSPPLRTTAELPLKRSDVEGRTASSQHQSQTRHTAAAAVAECACHVLALSATSEPAPDVANALN